MTDNNHDIESLRVLYELSVLIRSEETLEDKFFKALELIKQAVQCDSSSLFLYDDEKETLEEAATVGSRVDLIESTQFEMGAGLSAWVAKQRDSILLPDVRKKSPGDFRSFISTPLLSGDRLIGVVNVGHQEPYFLNEHHQQILEIIAGELAATIERARYEEEVIAKNHALTLANQEIEKQQQQIVEMERYQVLAQVAASINHEINNPLTTIIGNAELILMKYDEMDDYLKTKINLILNEGKRIGQIIEKLRDVKKIVVKDYVKQTGETMIDIMKSAGPEDSEKSS